MTWRYRYTVLALVTLAFAATMTARLVVSPLVPDVTGAFATSKTWIGLALTGMWAAYALSQYPGGFLADKYGERSTILAAVGLLVVASAALALSPVLAAFGLASVLLGAAAGVPYTPATSIISKNFDETGRAIGVFIAGGPFAGLVAPVAATAVGSLFGWRAAVFLGALVAAPVFVAFRWLVRPTPPGQPDASVATRVDPDVVGELLTRPAIAFTVVLAVGGAFTWQATASFLPTFLVERWEFTQARAGLLFSLYFVVHGVTQPVTGWLSDRLSRNLATVVTMGAAAVGFATLLLAPTREWAVAGIPLVGLGMSWGAPVQTRFLDNLDAAERATGFGLVRTVYLTVGATGSVVVGALSDAFGWTVAFGVLVAIMTVEVTLLAGHAALRRRD